MGAVLKGDFAGGLIQSARLAAAAVHRKPILSISLPTQIGVDENNVPTADESLVVDVRTAETVYHFRVDPKLITSEHNYAIAAERDRLTAGTRMFERIAMAQNENGNKEIKREDLPNAQILKECYQDQDNAAIARLIACTIEWDYTDEHENPVLLTAKFLRENVRIAEAMDAAFLEWYNPTKKPSAAATGMNPGAGMTAGDQSPMTTGSPQQSSTPIHSLSDSPSPSTLQQTATNGATPSA